MVGIQTADLTMTIVGHSSGSVPCATRECLAGKPWRNSGGIGGGSGWQLDILERVDPRIGFTDEADLDEKSATIARQTGHASFYGRIEDYENAERFQLILLLNLIEHVPTPLETLQQVASLLAPSGMALIQTPNYASLDARLFRKSNWGGIYWPRHFVLFESGGFPRLAEKACLKVVDRQYTQGARCWALTGLSGCPAVAGFSFSPSVRP